MSEVKTFFRFCPSCGKRFHIRLVSKKLEDERVETTEMTQASGTYTGTSGSSQFFSVPVVLEEKVPVVVDVRDFQYSYKCKHCGHVWTEMHEKEE